MSDLYILHYTTKEELDTFISVNFFYLIDEVLSCCTIALSEDEFKGFKSIRNKHKFLEKRITNSEFILNSSISHLITIEKFIKVYGIEKKWRQYQLKKLLKGGTK